jgi:carbamoyl-phosphate synthase small subunit
MTRAAGVLALEDGSIFRGEAFGASGTAEGEVVFNTAMSGYQEILTDPSYCGQIVTMTAPLIGNYGMNTDDDESSRMHLSGFICKELSPEFSNYRATGSLHEHLNRAGVIGLAGIDTRALTKRLRQQGSLRGVISSEGLEPFELVARARAAAPMEGANLVERVAPGFERQFLNGGGGMRVLAVDCGLKQNIVRELVAAGCSVTTISGGLTAADVLARKPSGLLVGNGPGDPAAVTSTIEMLKGVVGKIPVFGICLGHQMLALALGARTYKLKSGHHGANHPVLNTDTGRVEITSQNHGFAVDLASLDKIGGRATHISLYDRSLEGFAHDDLGVFAVQYHPEAAPGPHDSGYLFMQFARAMRGETNPSV